MQRRPRQYLIALGSLCLCSLPSCANLPDKPQQVNTFVVIYAENRSFDNLYGLFPGANGILKNADGSATDPSQFQQLERDGVTPLLHLPQVWRNEEWPMSVKTISKLNCLQQSNGPVQLDAPPCNLPLSVKLPDPIHNFYVNQMQINGGKNNMFATWSNTGGLPMAYYDGSSMQLWQLARQYTLMDNFFMGAFGGSFLNHFWLVCACTPRYDNAPQTHISVTNQAGTAMTLAENSPASALVGKPSYVALKKVTPDGYAIGTLQPPYPPSKIPPATADQDCPRKPDPALPAQDSRTMKTIGDTLSAKNISWAWYAGAWQQALKDPCVIDNPQSANFQPHHQPFNYFSRFDPNTPTGAAERAIHLQDYSDLLTAIKAGNLPQVVFYKPQGSLNQHPGYAEILAGDTHIAEVVRQLQASPQWPTMAIIVTYDENGGYWDHVAPPPGDRWGPGTRIPAILISPFAKKGYVDHTYYDTTSIIKFISTRFSLEPLPGVRSKAGDFRNAFIAGK